MMKLDSHRSLTCCVFSEELLLNVFDFLAVKKKRIERGEEFWPHFLRALAMTGGPTRGFQDTGYLNHSRKV